VSAVADDDRRALIYPARAACLEYETGPVVCIDEIDLQVESARAGVGPLSVRGTRVWTKYYLGFTFFCLQQSTLARSTDEDCLVA